MLQVMLITAAVVQANGLNAQLKPAQSPAAAYCNTAPSELTHAVILAHDTLHASWLETPEGYFIAYDVPAEHRHLFDASKDPLLGQRTGLIETGPIDCVIQPDAGTNAVTIRFKTLLYRIYEQGQGWGRPLRDGLVMEIAATMVDGQWTVQDRHAQTAILDPSEKVRRPQLNELPDRPKAWAEPLPPCQRGTRWQGMACVSTKK